jgi:hypothetical protein
MNRREAKILDIERDARAAARRGHRRGWHSVTTPSGIEDLLNAPGAAA